MQHDDARFLDLLQRWQNGDFTRADEQELNALAASDDFRREAMEGFMSLPDTAHDDRLTALRLRLQKRVGGQRVLALPQILAAAAVLVLLLAALWFFPKWNEKNNIATVQTQTESTEQTPASEPSPSVETPGSQDIASTSPSAKSRPSTSGPGQPAAGNQPITMPENDIVAVQEEVSVSDDSEPDNLAHPLETPNIPPARVRAEKAESEAKKDEIAATRTQENAQSAKAKAQKESRTDSAWHETDRKPDMDAEKKAARDEMQKKESEPEGGWDAFNEYLRQNARLTPEARNRNVSGTVRLQFSINTNGEPFNFIVLRSVGYGCDQEAVRLVQNWEWERGQNPVVIVEVPFVR